MLAIRLLLVKYQVVVHTMIHIFLLLIWHSTLALSVVMALKGQTHLMEVLLRRKEKHVMRKKMAKISRGKIARKLPVF